MSVIHVNGHGAFHTRQDLSCEAAKSMRAIPTKSVYQLPMLTISPVERRNPSLKSEPFILLSQECR